MLAVLFLVLIALWFLGYIHIDGLVIPDIFLFSINGVPITLWNLLILFVVAWAIGLMPSPIRIIVGVILILWILAVLGILAIGTFPLANILVLAIIIGIIVVLLSPSDVV